MPGMFSRMVLTPLTALQDVYRFAHDLIRDVDELVLSQQSYPAIIVTLGDRTPVPDDPSEL
jgi:hypothetical protein